jgi:predicted nucleic acid-binding protein
VNVLVDTSVWSLALRHRAGSGHATRAELAELIREGRVAMIGPIRQELLSGIRRREDFDRLRERLADFPDTMLTRGDYERGAEHFNTCRAKGVQGSNTDFLLCAVAERLRSPIFTTDHDFRNFARLLPIQLHIVRSAS